MTEPDTTIHFVEYSKSSKAKCNAGRLCSDPIKRGTLRMGTTFQSRSLAVPMTKYRHWDCVTKRVLKNVGSISNLQNLSVLTPDDRKRVQHAFELGYVEGGREEYARSWPGFESEEEEEADFTLRKRQREVPETPIKPKKRRRRAPLLTPPKKRKRTGTSSMHTESTTKVGRSHKKKEMPGGVQGLAQVA